MKKIYPPKPLLISIDQPLFMELELRSDCVVEAKYNGTRLILYHHENGSYEFYNRHGESLKYNPQKELIDQLNLVKWDGEVILDGELMHFKTKTLKDTVVIFDVYLWNDFPTTGFSFRQRRQLLEDIFPAKTKNLSLAPQWKTNFKEIYNELIQHEEIEGLVIKSLNAKVELGRSDSPVVKTMWKVRKPSKNYRF